MKIVAHSMVTFFFSNHIAQGQTIAIGKITKLITSDDQ